MRRLSLLIALLLLAPRAHAEAGAAKPTEAKPTEAKRSRLLPVAAAVLPGAVVHGTGHLVSGDSATGKRLLWMEGIGLSAFLTGGVTLAVTGASRYLVAPAATVTMLGFGLFSASYAADIYGTANNDSGAAWRRVVPATRWETELGYRRLQDAQFPYRDFLVQRVSRQIGPLRLSPSGWFSTAGDTARYRAEAAYRIGPDAALSSDVGRLEVAFAVTHQRHRPDHFTQSTVELSIDGRQDLTSYGGTLRGAFIDLGIGYALGRIDYDVTGLRVPHDLEHILLGRIGFGVTLRGPSVAGSEVVGYYDHRHDDYVAGLKLPGRGSGIGGHFGLAVRWFFNDQLGVLLDAQAGSAYLAGASLLVRSPPHRHPGALR